MGISTPQLFFLLGAGAAVALAVGGALAEVYWVFAASALFAALIADLIHGRCP